MRHTMLAAVAIAISAAGPLAGCGGGDKTTQATTTAATAPSAATGSIRIENFLFEPDPVTVKAGRKIAIANADSAPHTITEEGTSPSFDSGTVNGRGRGSVTFRKAGTFKYLCVFHPTMKGTVTVVQ